MYIKKYFHASLPRKDMVQKNYRVLSDICCHQWDSTNNSIHADSWFLCRAFHVLNYLIHRILLSSYLLPAKDISKLCNLSIIIRKYKDI